VLNTYTTVAAEICLRQQMAKLICLRPKQGSGSSQAIICLRPSWALDPQTEICPGQEMAKQICLRPKLGSGSPQVRPGDGKADMPVPKAWPQIPPGHHMPGPGDGKADMPAPEA